MGVAGYSAISNLQTVPTPAGTALKTSCQLNLALCYVKLGKNDDAIKTCTDVLSDDPDSLKATYRRGQAQLAKVRARRAAHTCLECSSTIIARTRRCGSTAPPHRIAPTAHAR
jgi:predicted negative regulator of RcsB-dependent stress response